MGRVKLGIITGSGTYRLPGLSHVEETRVETRYGVTQISSGRLGSADILHVSRHGEGHARLSSQVNHRANVLALRDSGAEAVLGVTVCGAVDPSIELGTLLVFDDLHFLANRLPDGSICTLYDEPGMPGRGHWIFESPFSAPLREALLRAARGAARRVLDGGCYGHVDGPRFNSSSEIRSLASCGVTAVSQTAGPETVLCGEAELPYALLGYATDYANGVQQSATPVSELTRLIEASTAAFTDTLAAVVALLDGAELTPVGTHIRWS
jgi:5'-methylthioadenosine phosphorylase